MTMNTAGIGSTDQETAYYRASKVYIRAVDMYGLMSPQAEEAKKKMQKAEEALTLTGMPEEQADWEADE